MPSSALSAMRTSSTGGSNSSARGERVTAIVAPTAADITSAASVTWLGVTPARTSPATSGRSSRWNLGFKS
jgi:hypothetical protein